MSEDTVTIFIDTELQDGWPQTTGDNVRSSPAIGDIDNDGDLEIVSADMGLECDGTAKM